MSEEIKHFAVKATHLIWIIFLSIILCVGLFVFTLSHVMNLQVSYGELKGRVDVNEDDVVDFQKWRDKYFYESLHNGGK